MKAVCVTSDRKLVTRDIPLVEAPPPGHLLLQMDSSAINHGDIAFLARGLSTAMNLLEFHALEVSRPHVHL